MKLSIAISLLSLVLSTSAAPHHVGRQVQISGGAANATSPAVTASSPSATSVTSGRVTSPAVGTASLSGAANATATASGTSSAAPPNNTTAPGNSADPQKSLTLDPRVIAPNFAQDGQDPPVTGQSPSLTSTNNFINFCLTVPDLPITDGKQIRTGSCNPAPIGVIPSTDNMPSSKFTNPKNGDTVKENTAFTISMAVRNLVTGNFVNPDLNYFAAPQQLNSNKQIIGHSHVVLELLESLNQTTPTDPRKFAFFKGINGAAQNGIVTSDVTKGLPSGAYRMCSINSSSNHQPVIVAIAQHGSLDDCIYFSVTADGQAAPAPSGSVSASSAAASASASGVSSASGGGSTTSRATGTPSSTAQPSSNVASGTARPSTTAAASSTAQLTTVATPSTSARPVSSNAAPAASSV